MKKQYFILGLLLAGFQFAQAQFTLEGEFRPRTELLNNGFNYRYQPIPSPTNGVSLPAGIPPGNLSGREGTTAYLGTSVRAALNSTYTTDAYKLYLGIQEVFNVGDRNQISASGNGNIRFQEAWADIKLSDTWRFKVGRQPLSYDDQRILGGLGWAQQARTHDVGVLKHKKSGYSLDLGYSLNTNGGNIFRQAAAFTYRELAFLHANKKFCNLNLSALILNTTFQNGTENKSNLTTAGLHAGLSLGKLGLSSNVYIQDGQRVGDQDVNGATLLSLDAKYKATDAATFLAGIEAISGRETNGDHGFFPLYGTNHKFNGYMDRFFVGNHALGSGLIDLNIGGTFKLGKGYNLTTRFHNFKEESRAKNNLGNEIDFVVAKKFNGYKLVLGYSQFFESDDFPNPAGNPEAQDFQSWAWAMLVIKPKFFTGK